MAANRARDRILDSAEARLLKQGPRGLVLEAVARDAGVSKGGLLYHFPSKEALVSGLVSRMLDGFDEAQDQLAERDRERPGAWTRAYLASTVTERGVPADSSAQLMAGILAVLDTGSPELDVLRERFGRWHRRIEADDIEPTRATIVRLAADGLWLSELLGLPALPPETSARVVAALREMSRGRP